ncbi:hypothetical protein Ndes2437B_g03094 [Nannochloris sp. 'desiccata']
MAPTVLIAGGSGYLGQFLVDKFARDGWNVAYTYNTSTPPPFPTNPTAFKVDFVTGEGLDACFSYLEDDESLRLDAVINCVAVSQPVACEKDPEKARLIKHSNQITGCFECISSKNAFFAAALAYFSCQLIRCTMVQSLSQKQVTIPILSTNMARVNSTLSVQSNPSGHVIMLFLEVV